MTATTIRSQREWATLQGTSERLVELLTSLRADLAKVAANRLLSDLGQQQREARLQAARDDLDRLGKEAQEAKDRIDRQFTSEGAPGHASDAQTLLAELRTQAAWQRIKPILDADGTESISAVARFAQQAGDDPATIGALRSTRPSGTKSASSS